MIIQNKSGLFIHFVLDEMPIALAPKAKLETDSVILTFPNLGNSAFLSVHGDKKHSARTNKIKDQRIIT